jgi:hypothetical protein
MEDGEPEEYLNPCNPEAGEAQPTASETKRLFIQTIRYWAAARIRIQVRYNHDAKYSQEA